MSSIYLKSDSPFYQLRYYDRLEEDPARRRKTFSTKVKATPSDQKRALGKDKLIGSPEVRKIKKSFEDALFERNLYAKTKIKLRRSPLFSTGFTEFLIEKPNLAAATITLYKFTSSHFVNACGDKDITDYSIEDYSRFIKYCAAHKFSDTTNSIHTRHLFSLFNYFIKKRYIAENIIIKLKTPRRDPEPVPFDDMQIILDYFEQRSFWQYAFVYFLLLTGMRESSALIQTRDDIDIEARVIKAINVKA
jgi:integrase